MEDMPTTRDGIADAITADLQAADTAATPPAPVAPAPAEAVSSITPPEVVPAAPTAEVAPEPLALTDKSMMIDPVTGEKTTWGAIKAERLRHADYTKKTQAVADERRAVEAMRAQIAAEAEAGKARAAVAHLPELPEDDPYAQRIRAVEAQTQAYLAAQAAQNQAAESDRMAAASARLDAEVAKVATEFELSERETDRVGRELWARIQRGEDATLQAVAKEYAEERKELQAKAVKAWQDKHRVSAPAAAVSVPAAGTSDKLPAPGSRSFADAIREEIGALMR